MALGYMRRHRRWLYGFLWLVIAAFIVFYIPAFLDEGAGGGQVVGRVGDYDITVPEFRREYNRQLEMYRSLNQGRLDPAMARRMGVPDQVFRRLAQEALIAQEAHRLGITVDDATLARRVMTMPGFVGVGELRRILSLQGITEEQFRESLRRQVLRERLETLVTSAVDVTPAEVESEYRRRNEQVRVEYAIAAAEPFRAEIDPSAEQVKAWFEARKEEYRIPERRVIEYVLLDRDTIRRELTVSDREIEVYYNANSEEFLEEESVCASHVLVKVAAGPEAGEGHPEDEARAMATRRLESLRAGADFAAVAREASEDQGSAANGGDLGCFSRGQMVPEFENAAFGLEVGELSDLVRSSFGFHIIRLNARREETVQPLDQVRERVRQLLLDERTQERVEERLAAIATDLVKGRSLQEAGVRWGIEPKQTDPVARGATVEPLTSPALTARAFELEAGTPDPQPLSLPRGQAFISVVKIEESHLPAFDAVREKAREDVITHHALEKARSLAEDLATRAQSEELAKAAAALELVAEQTQALVSRGQAMGDLGTNAMVEKAVFALEPGEMTKPLRVESGYAVVKVVEKKPIDPAELEKTRQSLADSLREAKRRRLFDAYLAEAAKRFPVERTDLFREVVGG